MATNFPAVESPTNTRAASVEEPKKKEGGEEEPTLLQQAEDEPEEVVKKMQKEWDKSVKDREGYNEQWRVNLYRSEGYLGAYLDKVQDRQEARVPYGAAPSITGLDKAQRLRDRLASVTFADEPKPDVIPTTGQDISADNAQFQERILQDESSEGRLGYLYLARDGFHVAGDYGSGFLHFYIDPEGRGPEPVQIKAHPDALRADDPLIQGGQMPDGSPVSPKAPVLRYVTEDGGLTDDRHSQPLQHQFLPKLCASVLTGRHVAMLPGTARDLWDASVVLIGAMVPLGDVKSAFPSVGKMDDEQLKDLIDYRPNKAKDLLPVEQRKLLNDNKVSDNTLVFQLLRYELPNGREKKGSYLASIGEKHLAYHGEWWDQEHGQPMDLPLTQFTHYRRHGNPYGCGAIEKFGPGNELLSMILDAMIEHMERFGDTKVFVPTTSSVRPEQLESESHRYIPISPQGQPVSEQIPDFPITYEKMYGRVSAELDDESGLQQAGQGMQGSNVKSARHFQANVQQVQVLLSDLRQNTARGLCRGWRVMAQLVRAFYTIPQLLKWEGEDGAYHVKEWAGSDLIGLGDVQIQQGSFTGMLPAQKLAMARELYLQDKILRPDEYRRIATSQFNPILAVNEDPHFQRVKRQIDRWLEGPPEGWTPPQAPIDPMTGQPQMGPNGQPVPPPPDPLLSQIFDVRPADDEPGVAPIRMQELGRTLASAKFTRFPPPWQQALVQAYQMARQAAQMPNPQQIQEMQKQLQKAQQDSQVSFGATLTVDPQQSAAILQQKGVQIPPPNPAQDGKQELSADQQFQLEIHKHQASAQADVEKERIKAAAKVESETRQQQAQQQQLAQVRALIGSAQGKKMGWVTKRAPDGTIIHVPQEM